MRESDLFVIGLERQAIRDSGVTGQEYEKIAFAAGKDANPILKDPIGENSLFWWIVPEKGLLAVAGIGSGHGVLTVFMRDMFHLTTFRAAGETP